VINDIRFQNLIQSYRCLANQVQIKQFNPVGSIKALDVRVLRRLARLDEVEHDVIFFSPVS